MNTPSNGKDHLETSYRELQSRHSDSRLTKSMRVVCFTGAIAHILFLFLFVAMDAVFLALFNIVSIAVWIYAFVLSQQHQLEKSLYIISAEIFIHAVVATYLVGPSLGFQYYMWPLMIMLLTMPTKKLKQSTFLCTLVVLSFVTLTITTRNVQFSYQLSGIVDFIYAFNIAFAAIPFIFSVLYLRSSNVSNAKTLFSQANMDPLTNTYNRRFVNDLMESTNSEQRRRSFDTYSLVLGDVDHFHYINDKFGHQIGDKVIQGIANILKENVRDTDIVSRWGGEEFLIILANADIETTEKVVRKVRHCINNIDIPELQDFALSMSFGISQAHRHMSFEETVRQTDIKLYQAKSEGRDRMLS